MKVRIKPELSLLKEWKNVLREVIRVVKTLYPNSEVYLAGGAAEGRLTVLSDIDVLVVFDELPSDRADILAKLWEALEERIPIYYPIQIHVLERSELGRIRGRKIRLA